MRKQLMLFSCFGFVFALVVVGLNRRHEDLKLVRAQEVQHYRIAFDITNLPSKTMHPTKLCVESKGEQFCFEGRDNGFGTVVFDMSLPVHIEIKNTTFTLTNEKGEATRFSPNNQTSGEVIFTRKLHSHITLP